MYLRNETTMLQCNARSIYFIAASFVFLLTTCKGQEGSQQSSSLTVPEQCFTPVVHSVNEFGASLTKALGYEGNLFISPFSIYAALAMTYLGAGGRTAQQMEEAFHLTNSSLENARFHESFRNLMNAVTNENDEYKLFLANGMFLQQDFVIKDKYIQDITRFYHAIVKTVDFVNGQSAAKDEINNFVAENTRNKINEFLKEPLHPQTVLALINAIYFKGTWKIQFPKDFTRDGDFHKNDGSTKQVKFMILSEQRFRFYQDHDIHYKFLELPYKGDHISMLLALPGSSEQLPSLDMNAELLCKIENQLSDIKMDHVWLPKFQLKYRKELTEVLNQLGIHDLFSFSANLTGIREEGDINVSTVVHEAVIDVNEEGSEAAAASGVFITRMSLPINVFYADHPFLFYIIDKRNGLVLFSGRVSDP